MKRPPAPPWRALAALCLALASWTAPRPARGAAAPVKADDPLDVTVTGEAKDEAPVTKTPPPAGIPFHEVIPLSREGQTEQVLNDPVRHMTPEQQIKLVETDAQQTIQSLPVRLPRPPFFRVESPASALITGWRFEVIDQNNQLLLARDGTTLGPTVEWDGFQDGQFNVLVGPAYSCSLVVTDEAGRKRRVYGDPLQLDAVQYEQDGLLHIEFGNDRLYEKGGAAFASDMEPLVRAALNVMRQRVGTPFRVIVYENPGGLALAQKRIEGWKKFLLEELVIDPDSVTMVAMAPKDRGRVTAIMMLAQP